ncbi:hypothetical protein F480_11215 [Bibersteinia trehalosi Y31]|uniref:DUF5672 domain-containing protein n=2 Tax=Bibersteinia trehalosi TaxID=47735 RepID=A0A179CYW1_BIBTR|nr:hypothetical protein F480_11215 [Bibersteinia trehalosi Y31]
MAQRGVEHKGANMLNSITIVAVTGMQAYAQNSVYAIQRSYLELQKQLPAERLRCLLISPEKPEYFFDNIQHIACKPFGYLEYSLFMVYSLAQFIETSHVLIVQEDGWVLNGNNWRDEFFQYDYIGSPLMILVDEKGKTYRDAFWEKHKFDIPDGMIGHQNGGFSLRSKKLLEAARKYQLGFNVQPPEYIQSLPFEFKWTESTHQHYEDVYFLQRHKQLSELGFKFAPPHLAALFGFQHLMLQVLEKTNVMRILGCHFSSSLKITGLNQVTVLHHQFSSMEELIRNGRIFILVEQGMEVYIPPEVSFNGQSCYLKKR